MARKSKQAVAYSVERRKRNMTRRRGNKKIS
jgi:hypothetical protein